MTSLRHTLGRIGLQGWLVAALLAVGTAAGLLLAIFLSGFVMLTVKVDPGAGAKISGGQGAAEALRGGILPLLMPVFVVGSILAGVVTPTEAASFAVGYALITGLFVYRQIRLSALPRIFSEAMRDSAVILIIIAAVSAANWLLTYNRVPNILTDWVLGNVDSKTTFLIAVILLFLFGYGVSLDAKDIRLGLVVEQPDHIPDHHPSIQ